MAKATIADIRQAILRELPKDGTAIGNIRLRELVAERLNSKVSEDDYLEARDELLAKEKVESGKGRGGSVRRVVAEEAVASLTLESQEIPEEAKKAKPKQTGLPLPGKKTGQATRSKSDEDTKILSYRHKDRRKNNPDVGVVTPETDPDQPKTTWAYDPHLDPVLQFDVGRAQVENLIDSALASGKEAEMRSALESLKRMGGPYLNWTGKAERTSFEVDTVSLHVHERIDPASILSAVRKRIKGEKAGTAIGSFQPGLFAAEFENLPLREAIDFYKHDRGWSNRLIAGDSLLVMNSLLQKESMAGQVQMIYIDPPYGIKYGSNFQPFVNKRDVKDRKDEDLTQEPEMIKAFRDTWELGIHSYLTYLRDRLLLAKELLNDTGSVFVQISDENVHRVRLLLDEVFSSENFISLIHYTTSGGFTSETLSRAGDFIVWYAKDVKKMKYHPLYFRKDSPSEDSDSKYDQAELSSGKRLGLNQVKNIDFDLYSSEKVKVFRYDTIVSSGYRENTTADFKFQEKIYHPGSSNNWKASMPEGMARLGRCSRIASTSNSKLTYVRYFDDFPMVSMTSMWTDIGGAVQSRSDPKVYVVQTGIGPIERCLLMTSDPGDLVLDPTCGSGTTAFVAEKWGRRWITCDTSRVATTLAKQRMMTTSFDYYELKYPNEGLRGGFIYKTVPHVTLKSIANNPDIDEIWDALHPDIEAMLASLNSALKKDRSAQYRVSDGERKGITLNFSVGDTLREWEVPFDFPENWQSVCEAEFKAFHASRLTMQAKMEMAIAANADQETLFDQPQIAKDKLRITGPFSMEAVPFPTVFSLDETEQPKEADAAVARSGESHRQYSLRDELLKTGIRGKNGQMLNFAALEILSGTRHLHCEGSLVESGDRVVISFGPEHAALEQRQVEMAMREAGDLFPRPKMIVFCAFAFDPEAAKDIDQTKGIVALKAQMNTDLLTEDLKKNARSNQSFWLMGQPDVEVKKLKDGKYQVEVHGFDYFDTVKGDLVSGGKSKIAVWSLDTDYDERSLYPRQVFFPLSGKGEGWEKLKKNIKAELNEELLNKFHGTVSLPFEIGENRKIAVKIVDDRGIESLKVITID